MAVLELMHLAVGDILVCYNRYMNYVSNYGCEIRILGKMEVKICRICHENTKSDEYNK